VCGPFAARGAEGEEEYPSRWLGGTGELTEAGKQERERKEQGVGKHTRQRYVPELSS